MVPTRATTRAFWRGGRSASRRRNSRSRSRTSRLPKPKSPPLPVDRSRGRAGVRSLQPAVKLEELTSETDITGFLARAFPNICAMRRCENPGRWIPRSATTSIPRSNTPMTGTRRAACPAPASSARASMSRGWSRRSWARANRRPSPGIGRRVPTEIAKDPESSSEPEACLPEQPLRLSGPAGSRWSRILPMRRADSGLEAERGSASEGRPILLHRNSRCDAMAPQNPLFRQKFSRHRQSL